MPFVISLITEDARPGELLWGGMHNGWSDSLLKAHKYATAKEADMIAGELRAKGLRCGYVDVAQLDGFVVFDVEIKQGQGGAEALDAEALARQAADAEALKTWAQLNAFVKSKDMTIQRGFRLATLWNEDGDVVMDFPITWTADDLKFCLRHADTRYKAGVNDGREQVQKELRKALGMTKQEMQS